MHWGATTSSGRFAATVRGCRPPFAENSASLSFPDVPGSGARGMLAGGHAANAGRGNDLIRPLCGHLPHPGEGNTGSARPSLKTVHWTVTRALRAPNRWKAIRAAASHALYTTRCVMISGLRLQQGRPRKPSPGWGRWMRTLVSRRMRSFVRYETARW